MKVSIENNKIKIIVNNECSLEEVLDMVDKFESCPEWDDYELVLCGVPCYNYLINGTSTGYATSPFNYATTNTYTHTK